MSYQGLYSGFYSQIREYAELLDQVLLDFKTGTPDAHTESRLQLGELLVSLGDRDGRDLRIELLASLLREAEGLSPERLAKIGQEVTAGRSTPLLLMDLEQLARTLEKERVVMFSKIRGR